MPSTKLAPSAHVAERAKAIPVLAEGFFFGVDQQQLQDAFDPNYPYSYCRICGWVYQPPTQRKAVPPKLQLPNAPYDSLKKRTARQVACARHSRNHTKAQHEEVGLSGITPEAQYRLAAFGIANLQLISTRKENEQAGLEAPIPGFWLPDTDPLTLHK